MMPNCSGGRKNGISRTIFIYKRTSAEPLPVSVLQAGNEIYSAVWNGYRQADCVHIASATKSVMALLTGIAIDRKMIGSVNDKVLSYFYNKLTNIS